MKTYRYFVSFEASGYDKRIFGNTIMAYDEPLDTQDMLNRATKDIKNNISDCYEVVIILFWKRIKDNG